METVCTTIARSHSALSSMCACRHNSRHGRGSTSYNILQLKSGKDCHNTTRNFASAPDFYPEASSVLSELNGSLCSPSLPSDSFITLAQRAATGMWQERLLDLLGQKENSHHVKSWQQRHSLSTKGRARDLSENEL